jgi:hypothetical protein
MSLTSVWKLQKGELASKPIQAMIGLAGDDGKLRDGNKASEEFREFLTNVPSEMLSRYANECLGEEKFSEASSALQDVINEVGRRLGFKVQNGLYRGKVNEIGNDGLWHSADNSAIILEVKTTTAYSIDLDTLANYRKKLALDGKIELEKSSILIVVGRAERTDSLEAQVRGSRHAWDIRLISVEMLMRLVTVKEDLETPQALHKIQQILRPKEYTNVDAIIDLVFSAAEDAKEEEKFQEEIEPANEGEKKLAPVNFREACMVRIQEQLNIVLVKRSAGLYSSADDKKIAVACLNSRQYDKGARLGYWFGFHRHQKETLEGYNSGLIAFGCGSANSILLIPVKDFTIWLNDLNTTEGEDRFYWHVHLRESNGKFTMRLKGGKQPVDLTKYLIKGKA